MGNAQFCHLLGVLPVPPDGFGNFGAPCAEVGSCVNRLWCWSFYECALLIRTGFAFSIAQYPRQRY
jgi:hypothetical protein